MLYPYLFVPSAIAVGVLSGYLLWKLITYFYEVATKYAGIHFVTHRPAEIVMNKRFFNPFTFEVDLPNAGPRGVECTMMCADDLCYVKAMWCVSIYDLVEYLNKDWFDIVRVLLDKRPSFGGVYSTRTIVLLNDDKKVMEFGIPPDLISLDARLTGGIFEPRERYPFVVLMVLARDDYEGKRSAPYVLATAHAIHFADEAIDRSFVITQYIKLSSGHVGQVKKVYRASADERSDLCLVCCQKPASIVQIACCHFCLCRSCYEMCDKCPICRNTRMDFFELPPN